MQTVIYILMYKTVVLKSRWKEKKSMFSISKSIDQKILVIHYTYIYI